MDNQENSATDNQALLDLLCGALDARTEEELAGSLRHCQQHLNASLLFRLSVFFPHMERAIEAFGLPNRLGNITIAFVGEIHTLSRCALAVSERRHVCISEALELLGAPTYGDDYRTEQVSYQAALAKIPTMVERDDRAILKGLAFNCLNSFPLTVTGEDARTYSAIIDAASLNPVDALRVPPSKTIPRGLLVTAWTKAVWKTLIPSDTARRLLSSAFWSLVFGVGLWRAIGHLSSLRIAALILIGGVLVLYLAAAVVSRFVRLRPVMPTGAWERKTGTISLAAGSDQGTFQKSIAHELAHVVTDSGLFKRDLATLWEAYVMWRQWDIDRDSLAFFRKGLAGDVSSDQKLSDLELYVRSHDERPEEAPHEYSQGYFIFGRLVSLCQEDPDLTEALVTMIMRGEPVRGAWDTICNLPPIDRGDGAPHDGPDRLSLWTKAYITQNDDTRDQYAAALLARGGRFPTSVPPREILDSLQAIYKSNSSQWGMPLVELAAMLAGHFLERRGGSASLALGDAESLRQEACLKTLFHLPSA